MHPLLRTVSTVALAAATVACTSGLNGSEWMYCKEHLAAVDAAAEVAGIPKSQVTVHEPTWWPDYLGMIASLNNSIIVNNADFQASCNKAADTAAVSPEGRQPWCLSEGVDKAWGAAVELGLVTTTDMETFNYRAKPLPQRIDDADFITACRAAIAPPPAST